MIACPKKYLPSCITVVEKVGVEQSSSPPTNCNAAFEIAWYHAIFEGKR